MSHARVWTGSTFANPSFPPGFFFGRERLGLLHSEPQKRADMHQKYKKKEDKRIHAQYDCTTGVPDNGNEWRKFRAVPRLYPIAFSCFALCLIGVETEGLLDYQGRAGIISIVRWNLRPVIFGVELRFSEISVYFCPVLGRAIHGPIPVWGETLDKLSGTLVVHTQILLESKHAGIGPRKNIPEIHMNQWRPNLSESSGLQRHRSIECSFCPVFLLVGRFPILGGGGPSFSQSFVDIHLFLGGRGNRTRSPQIQVGWGGRFLFRAEVGGSYPRRWWGPGARRVAKFFWGPEIPTEPLKIGGSKAVRPEILHYSNFFP